MMRMQCVTMHYDDRGSAVAPRLRSYCVGVGPGHRVQRVQHSLFNCVARACHASLTLPSHGCVLGFFIGFMPLRLT